jgi:hypothetical protein
MADDELATRYPVSICGVPIVPDPELPPDTIEIRDRFDGRVLTRYRVRTVLNDKIVAGHIMRTLVVDDPPAVYAGPAGADQPPPGTRVSMPVADLDDDDTTGPLEQHLRTGGRAGDFIPYTGPTRAEIHRPRLRAIGDTSWIDVDEIIGIDVVDPMVGIQARNVQLVIRGGEVRTATVPGIETGDTDETAERVAREWVQQRFGDLVGDDMRTLHGLDALFGVAVDADRS